jgi:hypothetical protein
MTEEIAMAINSDSSAFQLNGWIVAPDDFAAGYDDDPIVEAYLYSLFEPHASMSIPFKDWGLSPKALSRLLAAPELADEAARERANPPFPAGYTPTTVELLYDDIVFVRSQKGEVIYLRRCPENYDPPFFEMRFDDQMALFLVEGEVVINRAIEMVNLETILGRLRSVEWR